MEGKDSVPRNRQRLFGQFDKRITESTKAIKLWVGEVERAQEARKQELKDLLRNQSKITSFFHSKQELQRDHRSRDTQFIDTIDQLEMLGHNRI